MKNTVTTLALFATLSSTSFGMQTPLYDEAQYAANENYGKNFTPVPKGGDRGAFQAMRENYKAIAHQTGSAAKRDGYVTVTGTQVKGLGIQESIKASSKININTLSPVVPTKPRLNKITIKEQDTFDAVIDITDATNGGAKIAVLNFANKSSAGGGYLSGSNAQEEDLCRRSTLYSILKDHVAKSDYPIEHDELIYTPKIKIFRDSYKTGFKFLEKTYLCDVITQAAYNLNPTHKGPGGYEGISAEEYYKTMPNKIRAQLRIAADKGCGTLILGAFGCGAFQNKPEYVAQLYTQILDEKEFQNLFNEVRFAILGKHNLEIFKEKLSIHPNLEIL